METELEASTHERYELKCKVLKKRMNYREHQSRGKEWNESADVILLVPDTSTESSAFFTAWLPDEADLKLYENGEKGPNCVEVGMRAEFPVGGFVRGALYRSNHLLPAPHIFVMTKRAEDILQKHVGKKINVTVLGEEEFEHFYNASAETRSPYSDTP